MTQNLKKIHWGNGLWGPLIFFAIGLLCFYAPAEMLSTLDRSSRDSLPNKTWFSYACGIIFCSGAIVFHANEYWKPRGYRKISTCGLLIGISFNLAGWAYVLWSIGSPWP